MNAFTLRCAQAADAPLLRSLAHRCRPLDVHTPYTYWVVCNYHGHCTYILEHNGTPAGYIMTVQMPCCLFIWQIGITEPFRGQGLSALLIGAAAEYAFSRNLPIQLSIDRNNLPSNRAFRGYCRQQGLRMEEAGLVDLHDLIDPGFAETEVLYQIDPPANA